MPSEDRPHTIGEGQVMKCRSWDDLISWSRAPERHSCFEMISDYRPTSHQLEHYAFCPENSPHYSTMKAYFEKHGHKPMFDDDVVNNY
jgi:hypothetical protein